MATFFGLGLRELKPRIDKHFGQHDFDPVTYSATAVAGLTLSVLLCSLLRYDTPATVIHAAPSGMAYRQTTHEINPNGA